MDRKEAVHRIALLLGGTVVGAELLSSCVSDVKKGHKLAGQEHISLLDEIGDTIIPSTSSPGAKAAGIGGFMLLMVQDCYKPADQKVFYEGIEAINKASNQKYNKVFLQLDAGQREALLLAIDKEQEDYMKKRDKKDPAHYFRMMKELTLLGFFTSEVGATKALRYVAVPGRYEEIPYKKGDKAWAT
ncbi:twin-arginine translocation pathway signal protein [Niabella ginsenosidivorans]|uniref:Twin-arginine translocation pathway signal protein n=1 Tax=Niabella ginsenosidivorans TaxID=1176587 RepID=A0A1A9HZD5_9BACT|nr:gluconate 2-dehydrogenase subunit 3 family protein [Niabella ginsenosidivorans]ANH79831.1 twin-arginine translocation pathway signal protein [Niabella ginsenosidivorans]